MKSRRLLSSTFENIRSTFPDAETLYTTKQRMLAFLPVSERNIFSLLAKHIHLIKTTRLLDEEEGVAQQCFK
jgi:hypothetical protein